MSPFGYAVVDVGSGTIVATSPTLPMRPAPPEHPKGRIATFRAVGQEAGGYRLVERVQTDRATPYDTQGTMSVSFDGVRVIVDCGWTTPSVAEVKASRVAEVKDLARSLIVAAFPEWKQSNMIARSAEMARIQTGVMRDGNGDLLPSRVLTANELAEEQAINAAWLWIKAVRTHSDALEAEIAALETAEAATAWVASGWPA